MKTIATLFVLSLFFLAQAHASGFEKNVMWSGKYAGYGSAAVSGVQGSQSAFFNPAGLATKGDVSANISPSWIHLEGNLASQNTTEETDREFIPMGGFSASHLVNDRFGIGAAAYVAGGSRAVYKEVNLTGDSSNVTFKPLLQTDLAIVEYALGGAYEIMPGLRFGATWRIVQAQGSLSTVKKTRTNTAYIHTDIRDAKQTRHNGFRLGLQYEAPEKNWGVGVAYRNSVTFNPVGAATGTVTIISSNTNVAPVVSPVNIGLIFPSAYSAGAHFALTENFKLLGGVDFAKYSDNDKIRVGGTISHAALGGTLTLPDIPLNWKDMWNFRLGGELKTSDTMAFRAGYVVTTPATSKTDAKATLPPAGLGHLITVGAGKTFHGNLDIDGALEYGFNHGKGSMTSPASTDTTKELLAGVETKTDARTVGIHTGVTYRF